MISDEEFEALTEENRHLSRMKWAITRQFDLQPDHPWVVALGKASIRIRDEIYHKMSEDRA